ncbi:MAG TPA: CoA-transferase [Chloroflexota bacterium]|nr:CoA-transferase [Chloroflexota bacterium]
MVKVVDYMEAAALVSDGSTLWIGGSGGGHSIPEKLIDGLEKRFLETGKPSRINIITMCGLGDFKETGVGKLAHKGLVNRLISGGFSNCPKMGTLADEGEIEGYTFPMGVISQLSREMAAGRPGLITHVGLHSFVDPRLEGGRQGPRKGPDLVEVIDLAGKEWLFYKPYDVDVTFIRGTTADDKGNISMEKEPIFGDNLSIAMAAHRRGGIVIAQVERLTAAGTIPGKQVKVPCILVDYVVVDPDPWQTYVVKYDPAYAGVIRRPNTEIDPLPLDIRKVIARRAALELRPRAVVNLGFGIANGIALVAAEEGIYEDLTLTVEQGLIGGIPAMGNDAGSAVNFEAMIDTPYQFDFYDGGGLDLAFLSFAEVDAKGNVNVSKFRDGVTGPGGFINIAQNAKKVFFLGTMTAGKSELKLTDRGVQVVQEGSYRKFVPEVRQVTWSGPLAVQSGQKARFITDRAVFDLTPDGMVLIEVAEGIDIRRDVLEQIPFPILIPREPAKMDPRLFAPEPMSLRSDPAWKESR